MPFNGFLSQEKRPGGTLTKQLEKKTATKPAAMSDCQGNMEFNHGKEMLKVVWQIFYLGAHDHHEASNKRYTSLLTRARTGNHRSGGRNSLSVALPERASWYCLL